MLRRDSSQASQTATDSGSFGSGSGNGNGGGQQLYDYGGLGGGNAGSSMSGSYTFSDTSFATRDVDRRYDFVQTADQRRESGTRDERTTGSAARQENQFSQWSAVDALGAATHGTNLDLSETDRQQESVTFMEYQAGGGPDQRHTRYQSGDTSHARYLNHGTSVHGSGGGGSNLAAQYSGGVEYIIPGEDFLADLDLTDLDLANSDDWLPPEWRLNGSGGSGASGSGGSGGGFQTLGQGQGSAPAPGDPGYGQPKITQSKWGFTTLIRVGDATNTNNVTGQSDKKGEDKKQNSGTATRSSQGVSFLGTLSFGGRTWNEEIDLGPGSYKTSINDKANWADIRGLKTTGNGDASQTFATNSDPNAPLSTHGSGSEAGKQTVLHLSGSQSERIAKGRGQGPTPTHGETVTTCDHGSREATTYSSSVSEEHEDVKLPAQLELYHKESSVGKLNNDIDNYENSERKVDRTDHYPLEGRVEHDVDTATNKHTVKGHADATDKKFQKDDPFSWTTNYKGNNTDEWVVGHKLKIDHDYTQPVLGWINVTFDSTWDQTDKLTTTLDTKQKIRHSTADGDTIDAATPASAHPKREIEHEVKYDSTYEYNDKRHMILFPEPQPTNWQAPADAVAGNGGTLDKWILRLHDRDDYAKQVDDDEYTFYIDLSTGQLRPTGGTSKHTVEIKESNNTTGWGEVQKQEQVALSQVVPIPGAELYWTYPAIVAHRTPDETPDKITNEYKYNYEEDSTFSPSSSSGSGGAFGAPIDPMADKSGDYTKSQSRTITTDTLADQKRILETGNPSYGFGPRFISYTPSAQTSRVGDAFTETGKHERGAGLATATVEGVVQQPAPYSLGGGEDRFPPKLQEVAPPLTEVLGIEGELPSLESFFDVSNLPRVIGEVAAEGWWDWFSNLFGGADAAEGVEGLGHVDDNAAKNNWLTRFFFGDQSGGNRIYQNQEWDSAINGSDRFSDQLAKDAQDKLDPEVQKGMEWLASESKNLEFGGLSPKNVPLTGAANNRLTLPGPKPQAAQCAVPAMDATLKSLQNHHIATIYGKWGDKLIALFNGAGVDIDGDINKMPLPGHVGRHTNAYHKWVYDHLNGAVGDKTGKDAQEALTKELGKLRRQLEQNPRLPYKDGGLE